MTKLFLFSNKVKDIKRHEKGMEFTTSSVKRKNDFNVVPTKPSSNQKRSRAQLNTLENKKRKLGNSVLSANKKITII